MVSIKTLYRSLQSDWELGDLFLITPCHYENGRDIQWDSVRVALTLLPFSGFVNAQMLIESAKSQEGSTGVLAERFLKLHDVDKLDK